MAAAYRHRRHFRIRLTDSSLVTFTSTEDAKNRIGLKSCYDTSNPFVTPELRDTNQTLCMNYEFDSEEEQTAFHAAVNAAWSDTSRPWSGDDSTQTVEHFKTEWLNPDDSISSTNLF